LYESDVELLKGPEWLNDRIIGFVFEHLQHDTYKDVTNILFISPEVTQFLKVCPSDDLPDFTKDLFVDKDFVFLPLNDNIELDSPGGTHWSLLVFSKPESAFYHFDSYGDSNQRHAWELVARLWPILGCKGEPTTRTANVLHQTNSHDCGVHVVCNAENVADHCALKKSVEGYIKATKEEITTKRTNLLKLIDNLKVKADTAKEKVALQNVKEKAVSANNSKQQATADNSKEKSTDNVKVKDNVKSTSDNLCKKTAVETSKAKASPEQSKKH